MQINLMPPPSALPLSAAGHGLATPSASAPALDNGPRREALTDAQIVRRDPFGEGPFGEGTTGALVPVPINGLSQPAPAEREASEWSQDASSDRPLMLDPGLSEARRTAQTEAVQAHMQMLTVAMRIDDAHAQAASTLAAMGPGAPLTTLQPPVIKIPSIQELYTRAIQDMAKPRR